MAHGEEQSIRVLPSLSGGMNPNVGSRTGSVTVRSNPYRSAIGPQ